MGNIGPSRQRYEVLPAPAADLNELDRELLTRAATDATQHVETPQRIQPTRR